jgi:hypothetical protein
MKTSAILHWNWWREPQIASGDREIPRLWFWNLYVVLVKRAFEFGEQGLTAAFEWTSLCSR